MLLAINDVETDPFAVELVGVLRELGVNPGGVPDQVAIDTVTTWAMIEDRESIAEALRSDTEDVILGENSAY